MVNKVESNNNTPVAQPKKPSARNVGRALTEALGAAVARGAARREAPGGGRLNNRTSPKKGTDHEEEVFHSIIDPISEGHESHNESQGQQHGKDSSHLTILPMAEKSKAAPLEIESPIPAPTPRKGPPISEKVKTAVESQTDVRVLKSLWGFVTSKEATIYQKVRNFPAGVFAVLGKRAFDIGMFFPRLLILRPLYKALMSVFNKLNWDTAARYLAKLTERRPLATSWRFSVFGILAKLGWAIPAALINALIFAAIKTHGLFSKDKAAPSKPKETEDEALARIKAERQAMFQKQKEERETRLRRERTAAEKKAAGVPE
ncbi:MAG: hypothetical protein JSS32_05030 [Verrucomicrobia bacterium]|nr:hypothetical protein [Verrucomicrobiota bacterium]